MQTILHIDNSTFYQKLLKDSFNSFGYDYISTNNVHEAYEIIEKNHIDLIVTALELEEGNGLEFLETMNEGKHNNIPIIVLSSTDSLEIRKEMFSLGAIDFIHKKISKEGLLTYIGKLTKKDIIESKLKDMKIAVLDDSQTTLNIIKNILEMDNIVNVDYFKSPEVFLQTDKEYNIYLIDVILPHFSGEHIILEIREKFQDAVIIAISAIDHYKTITKILISGADDYIMKPFNKSIFMARIKANLRSFLLLNEIREKNLELEKMVISDGLTKIYNHKYMYDRLEIEIKESRRYNNNFSIIMFDIDNFKKINDTYGHQLGDKVLIKISETIKETLREVDMVGRYGGEEFLVILPGTDLEEAIISANRVRRNIENLNFKEQSLFVTISGGAAEYKDEDALKLVEKADRLLYAAKQNGKNQIQS